MKFWIFIFMLTYNNFCQTSSTIITSTRNSTVFRLLNEKISFTSNTCVVIPNMNNLNIGESLNIEYQSIKTDISLQAASEWLLSVRVNQNFFYSGQQNPIVHVLCYLQFSIENSSRFVGSKVRCSSLLKWPKKTNISQSSSCEMKIGRSPSICSTYFDLKDYKFESNSPTWGFITAQLFLSDSLLATSYNSMAVVFNFNNKPVNWTVVQQHNHFGQLSLGLPITSVKTGSNLILPVSISDVDDISTVRILFDYDTCLSLNTISIIDRNRWMLKTNFEHSGSKESGVIRLQSLNRKTSSSISVDPMIIIEMNFTVVDKAPNAGCSIRAGISKVDFFSGGSNKYYNKNNFNKDHKSVPISIDPEMMDIISFKESENKTVNLFPSTPTDQLPPVQVSTYLVQPLGDHFFPQLLKTTQCSPNQTGKIMCPGYEPVKIDNNWALPVTIEHWRTVLYNLENTWRAESWVIKISDLELNPIVGWKVPYRNKGIGTKCVTMYQTARLSIGAKLISINSMGLKTFLGGSLELPDPWVDITSEMITSLRVISDPADIVTLSKSQAGSFLIKVNKSGSTVFNVLGDNGRILTSKKMSVYTSHWASVSRITGRCLGNINARLTDSHPNSEGEYLSVEIKPERLHIGTKCRLSLVLEFNDGGQMALEDIDSSFYMLEIDGVRVNNGDVIEYRPKVAVLLSESVWCRNGRRIYSGAVDLREDGVAEVQTTTTSLPRVVRQPSLSTVPPQVPLLDTNIVLIAGCVVAGVIVMALFIVFLNCVVAVSLRQQPMFVQIRRRLSKSSSRNIVASAMSKRRRHHHQLDKPVSPSDQYPALLPPPGPILPMSKQQQQQQSEWAASSESGLGIDHSSSQGSHHEPLPLSTVSTFRCSQPNGGSVQTSESSAFVRQTSPSSDVVVVDSISNSSSLLFLSEHLNSPQGCYWALANSRILQPQSLSTERSSLQDRL